MYTGYKLTEKSRDMLKILFPPKYPEFVGHHITEKFGVKDPNQTPPTPNSVWVVGHADDGKGIEALLVSIDGSTKRPSGGLYHITWSLDRSKGYKPVDSNKIISNAEPVSPRQIDVTAEFFRPDGSIEEKVSLIHFVNI